MNDNETKAVIVQIGIREFFSFGISEKYGKEIESDFWSLLK
jgi:hypothetical protein